MKNIKIHFLLFFVPVLLIYSCQSAGPPELSEAEAASYREKGGQIAAAAFTALSGELQQAIQAEGVAGAIGYCHLAALPLVDSLSKVHHALIRRTSDKVRNPADRPTEAEAVILKEFAAQAAAGEELKPVVQRVSKEKVAFYAPIKVNEFCLQCHGKVGETLSAENHALIRQFYPEDQAVGYSAGDLRGMWSIEFIY